MSMLLSIILAAVLGSLCSANTQSATWTAPPNAGARVDYTNNPILPIGSVFDLKWTSTLDTYSIWLWQQDTGIGYTYPGSPIYTKNATDEETGSASWTVDLQGFTLSQSRIYFLSICQNNSLVGAFTSHYFTVTQNSTSSTISSSSTAAPSSSSTSIASSTASHSALATGTSQPGNGMETGTKIGLGVSLGLGIPLVLLAAGALWVLYRRYGKPEYSLPPKQDGAEYWSTDPVIVTPPKPHERQELPALPPGRNYVRPRYELDHEV